jgi:hypothetical protein
MSRWITPAACAAASAVRDLGPVVEDPPEGKSFGRLGQYRPQVAAVHQFQHQERAVLVLGEVVDGRDAGVVEAGGGAALPVEAVRPLLMVAVIVQYLGGQRLDGDRPFQPQIQGALHLAHPAAPQRRLQPVPARQFVPCPHLQPPSSSVGRTASTYDGRWPNGVRAVFRIRESWWRRHGSGGEPRGR